MKHYIGVELGANNIVVGVVDKYGKLIRKDSVPTLKERPYGEIIKDIATLSLKVIGDEGISIKDVKYIGIGSPGIPNDKEGMIVRSYTLGFHKVPIKDELQKHINLPMHIENDANCVALAESVAGAAEDINHSVTIKVGTGIGGGIIINNKIYNGFNYSGAELGHMVIAFDGERCSCGRNGCWEAYASTSALIRQTKAAVEQHPDSIINELVNKDLSKITETTAFEAAKLNDETGTKVVQQYIAYLSEGIANVINILHPELILISGRISKLGETLLKPVRNRVFERVYCTDLLQPELKVAEMGSASIMVGAAMLGLYR
jgi:glucokinase